MKQFRQLLATVLALVMVLGVLPVRTFAEEAVDMPAETVEEALPVEETPATEPVTEETETAEETEPEVIPEEAPEEAPEEVPVEVPEEMTSVGVREMYWKNPLFEDLDTPEYVDDGLIPVMPRAVVTPSVAIEDLKTKMIARTSKVVVETYFTNDTSLTEEEFGYYLQYIWEYVFMSAMVHDGTPDGGDYLYWHVSDVDGEIAYDNSNSKKLYVQLTYKLTYTTSASQEKSVTSKVEEVLADIITAGMTDYEKVKAIYDYIIGRVTYDDAAVDNPKDILAHTAFGAIVQKSAVCDGYAVLFYRMCLEAGIDALMITGLADGDGDGVIDGAHAWNVVCLDGGTYTDGVYYNVDVTWDDAVLGAGYDYAYFLKCNDTFAYDHIRDDAFTGSNYNEDLPMATWDFLDDCIACGKCGENMYWKLKADGSLELTGTGAMYDSSVRYNSWEVYASRVEKVTVVEGITKLADEVFEKHGNLTDVSLPSTLTEIPTRAFYGCSKLEKIVLPEGVTVIGMFAFSGTGLKEITIPETLTGAGMYAFTFCSGVSVYISDLSKWCSLHFGGADANPLRGGGKLYLNGTLVTGTITCTGVTTLGRCIFAGYEEVTELIIPASVTQISYEALAMSYVEKITFLGDPPAFHSAAFANTTVTAVYPADNAKWTEAVRQNYSGTVTWVAECMSSHSYEEIVTAPTCTEEGYTTHTCQYCGDTYTDTPVAATGHNFTEWAEVDGITSRTCQNEGCGLVEYESCAKNLTTGKLYSDLSVALGEAVSGDTVVLLSNMDATAAPLLVFSGVTLDLGGYSLRVNYLIGLKGSLVKGNVVDKNGENGAKLIVPQNGIVLPELAPDGAAAGYKIIPVWNGDHYIFSQAVISNQSFTVTGDTAKVQFLPNFSGYVKNSLFKPDGCEDNDVSVIISVSWMESGIWVTQEYFYTTSLIIDAMNNKGLYAVMTGCDTKEDLVFRIAIVTGSGAQVVSQEYVYAEQ